MTPIEIAAVGAILGLGAVLQSAVGFGMPLVSIPLLLVVGHPLPVAVSLVLGAALVQTVHGSYVTRDLIHWRRAVSLAAIQWVTLFVGVACMSILVRSDPVRVKQVVGFFVILAVTVQWILGPAPRDRLAIGWALAAASSAGFMGGLVGIGGPPLVLFAMAHRWSPDAFRAFLWSQFLLVLPVFAAALAFRFGTPMLIWFGIGVAMAPIVWAGSRLGQTVTMRWNRQRLQVAALIVLYGIGLVSLIGPYLG